MATAKTFSEVNKTTARTFSEITKFNPYHGPDGRFTGPGAATSFTYRPGASTSHDKAIAREKERTAAMAAETPEKKRANAISSVESKIRNQNYESAAIIDKNGNQLLFKDGQQREVSFTREEAEMMRGATLTHNHPNSSMFSMEDVKMFTTRELQEIRAAGQNGTTYSLKRTYEIGERPKSQWSKEAIEYHERYEQEYKFINSYAKQYQKATRTAQTDLDARGFREKIRTGEISQADANKEFRNIMSKELISYVQRYGKKYGFELTVDGGGGDE